MGGYQPPQNKTNKQTKQAEYRLLGSSNKDCIWQLI